MKQFAYINFVCSVLLFLASIADNNPEIVHRANWNMLAAIFLYVAGDKKNAPRS